MKKSKIHSREITLNPYKIFWGIVTLNRSIRKTDYFLSNLPISYQFGDDHFVFHAPVDLINERSQHILHNLIAHGFSGKIYTITDKQYGMTKNSWDESIPECSKPFTHPIVLNSGKAISVFALSETQFNNAISF
ncbi:MAG: hypothetical protein K8S00_12220 [Bacteroidales bacterium]|nr:hypothetical protein [Bacteroidales bacterium]